MNMPKIACHPRESGDPVNTRDSRFRGNDRLLFIIMLLASCFFLLQACSGCRKDEPVQVSSKQLTLSEKEAKLESKAPNIKVINIGPSKKEEESPSQPPASKTSSSQELPAEVYLDDSLTARLKDKLKEAFEGRGAEPPQVDIYTSAVTLELFSKYYEDRGYKIQRTSVPASQVIAPLLNEKPELRDKISIGNYAGININQVIVEGVNISAADKYIDPETYEVVYKTFVTVTKTK